MSGESSLETVARDVGLEGDTERQGQAVSLLILRLQSWRRFVSQSSRRAAVQLLCMRLEDIFQQQAIFWRKKGTCYFFPL